MKMIAVMVASVMLMSGSVGAATVIQTTTPSSLAIWLESPVQPARAGIIIRQSVPLRAGQVVMYSADTEGTVHSYPDYAVLPYTMYQTSAVVVFPSGVMPPDVAPLSGFPWGGTITSPTQGMDLGQSLSSYYYPVSRAGSFAAPADDTYTVVLYMWGGISAPLSGMAAMCAYWNGNTSLTLTVLP